jgi:acetylornithine/succinyldiaminopimelate/putrescine aminotransferase
LFAAGMAGLTALLEENYIAEIPAKEKLFKDLLVHPAIKKVNSFGLWMAVNFESQKQCKKVIDHCIDEGVLSDWFLFAPDCLRISPPLTIDNQQIITAAKVILKAF